MDTSRKDNSVIWASVRALDQAMPIRQVGIRLFSNGINTDIARTKLSKFSRHEKCRGSNF